MCVCIYMLVYIYIYVHFFCMRHDSWTHIHSQVCNILHTCIQYISMCIYIYIHILMYTYLFMYIYTYTHLHIYIYICILPMGTHSRAQQRKPCQNRAQHTRYYPWLDLAGKKKRETKYIYLFKPTHSTHVAICAWSGGKSHTKKRRSKQNMYIQNHAHYIRCSPCILRGHVYVFMSRVAYRKKYIHDSVRINLYIPLNLKPNR